MSERHVAVVTGTRAEYGLLQSSMSELQRREGFELSVVATGMHLSPRYGHTVDVIRDDGFEISRTVDMLVDGDTGVAMAKSLGLGIGGLAEALRDLNPDMILVLGDRDEAFAAGVAAAHMNIPVAHIHGGDAMAGATIDDSIRHALTKFAHLHFPVSENSAKRILEMGEEPWRVTTVGAPGLDAIRDGSYTRPSKVLDELGLDGEATIVVTVQHPLTTQPDAGGEQMAETLAALESVEAEHVIVYPNADAGGARMIEAIEEAADEFHTIENLPRQRYLGLLAAADVLVGNSSSGILEAPSLDLPVVDIGPRQSGRERADYLIDVPHEADAIEEGIERALSQPVRAAARNSENPYDFRGTGTRVADTLASVTLDESLLRKDFVE